MKKTLTVFFILLPALLWSQSVDFKKQNFPSDEKGFDKALSNYNRGFDYFDRGPRYFEQSLKYLLEANAFNPNNADLNYVIGNIYNALNLKGEAAEYYKKAASLSPKYKKEGLRLSAENLHLDMQWGRAIEEYNDYIAFLNQEIASGGKKDKDALMAEIAEIQAKIKECENGKVVSQDTVSIVVINLGKGVNSKYPEYSAIVTADEKTMYFTSRRATTTGGGIPSGDVYYYEDIYQSTKGADGRWSTAKNAKGLINTKDHEGTVALSPDGKKMIIYRHKNSGDLYESKLGEDGSWGASDNMEGINSKSRETHASYSPDGKTIYFVSDNPSYGAKGLDIFKSAYDEANKKWGTPERLPETVNTDADEDGVFIDTEGKFLYFSSKGRNSMGGYDVFKSEIVNGVPSEAVNMGYPVNTPSDEIFYVVMPGGKRAYFNSARKGGYGEKDIYTMLLLKDLKLTLYGSIYDKATNAVIKDATIQITKNNTPLELTYPNPGEYTGEVLASNKYKAVVTAAGYEEQIEFFAANMEHPDSLSIQKDFFLSALKSFVLKGKVYDQATNQTIPGQLEISKVMTNDVITTAATKDGYETKLERDAVYKVKVTSAGYDAHEDMLSINELGDNSELVKDFYLLKSGTKAESKPITVKGFAYDKVSNKPRNATITVKDDKNKVVATVNATADKGYEVKLQSNKPYSFVVEADGYNKIEETYTPKANKNQTEATKNFYLEIPTSENLLGIKNIYFDYDKFSIRDESIKDLRAIVKNMEEFPGSKLELSGHTDNKGSYQYNLTLSLNRAKAAYDWLIANGVSKSRIKYTYYSFNKPAEPNQNPDGSDNPAGRQKNRRVEFKLFNVGSNDAE